MSLSGYPTELANYTKGKDSSRPGDTYHLRHKKYVFHFSEPKIHLEFVVLRLQPDSWGQEVAGNRVFLKPLVRSGRVGHFSRRHTYAGDM